MAASCSRILELAKTQCRIFSLNFNPQRLRLGNKILRQRLRGPTLAAWYPRKTVSFRDLQDAYRPLGLTVFDEYEDDREEAIQIAKLRGKGRPKKKRTAAESRSAKKEEIASAILAVSYMWTYIRHSSYLYPFARLNCQLLLFRLVSILLHYYLKCLSRYPRHLPARTWNHLTKLADQCYLPESATRELTASEEGARDWINGVRAFTPY